MFNILGKLHFLASHFPFALLLMYLLAKVYAPHLVKRLRLPVLTGLSFAFALLSGLSLFLQQGGLRFFGELHYLMGIGTISFVLWKIAFREEVSQRQLKTGVLMTCLTLASAFVPEFLTKRVWLSAEVSKEELLAKNIMPNAGSDMYFQKVRPILHNRCASCHLGDQVQSGFRLDKFEDLTDRYFYKFVTPHRTDQSKLYSYITRPNFSRYHMPYNQGDLPKRELELIEEWIMIGGLKQVESSEEEFAPLGAYSDHQRLNQHWSLEKIERPEIPKVSIEGNEIDKFVKTILEEEGVKYAPTSKEKGALLRNLSYSLTGLFPEVRDLKKYFQGEMDYKEFIDYYLGSHHFGENMALFWYDFAALADLPNMEEVDFFSDFAEYATGYKKYVIKSFNEDKSYIDFYTKQLRKINTQLYPSYDLADSINIFLFQPFYEVDNHSAAFMAINNIYSFSLGVNMACARCHDHPYAPISQNDYYSQLAFFSKTYSLNKKSSTNNKAFQKNNFSAKYLSLFHGGGKINDTVDRNLYLWMTDFENGVGHYFARTYVNAIWSYIMGEGLIKNGSDFFKEKVQPKHLSLLNWLTFYFIDNNFSTKSLVKKIVQSNLFKSSMRINKSSRAEWSSIKKIKKIEQENYRDNILKLLNLLDLQYRQPVDIKKQQLASWVDWKGKNPRSIYYPRVRSSSGTTQVRLNTPKGLNSISRRDTSLGVDDIFFHLENGPFSKAIEKIVSQEIKVIKKMADKEVIQRVYLKLFSRRAEKEEEQRWKSFFIKMGHNEKSLAIFYRVLLASNEYNFIK